MRKLIPAISALLAAALIAAGAFLPQITAFLMDQAEKGRTGSAPIQSVELNLRDETAAEYAAQRLAMESHMYAVPIDLQVASMTEEEVYAAVEENMKDYEAAGIFDWFPYTSRSAEPYMGIDAGNISQTGVFWGVTYVNEKSPYQYLFVHIDDETGKIYFLNYEDYGKESAYSETSPEYTAQMNYILDNFTRIFFYQLGLAEVRQYYDSEGLVEQEEVDGDVHLRRYRMGDAEYGEITIEFYANPAGFHLYYFG